MRRRAAPTRSPITLGTRQTRSEEGGATGVAGAACQSGAVSLAGLRVRLTGLLPSAFRTKISLSPAAPRLVENAIFVPSGDHVGSPSFVGSLVRFVCPLAAPFMTKMSPAVPSVRVKAIFVPSDDHAGVVSSYRGLLVRFVRPLPSALATKISWFAGATVSAKAIFCPSGDQAGVKPPGIRHCRALPSALATKICIP